MAYQGGDDISWSDDFYTIQQVVQKGLPTIVKVHEGYYTENEVDSFSAGDLIKLDFQKSYQKVAARLLHRESRHDQEGYILPGEEVMIPLGYKGKLKIDQRSNVFYNVKDLLRIFPKFVKLEKNLTVNRGDMKIQLYSGVTLELDRYIPGTGLVCVYGGINVTLEDSLTGQFRVIPDDTVYTLKEVIERFELPQIVKFLDEEITKVITEDLNDAIQNMSKFSGYLKLMRVVRQNVVVGHFKPAYQASATRNDKTCRRALAMLPLDSKTVKEIEVQIPLYNETDDYELLCVKNFSHNVDLDVIEGGLYVEFSRSPRIHIFSESGQTDFPPPPRPPLPAALSTVRRPPPPVPVSDDFKKETDTDEGSPVVPPRPAHKFTIPISDGRPATRGKRTTNQMPDSSSEEDYEPVNKPSNTNAPPKVKPITHQTTDSSSDEDYEPVKKPVYVNAPTKGGISPTSSMKSSMRSPLPLPGQKRVPKPKSKLKREDDDGQLQNYTEIPDVYEIPGELSPSSRIKSPIRSPVLSPMHRSFPQQNPRTEEDDDDSLLSDYTEIPDVHVIPDHMMEKIQKERPPIPKVFKISLKKVHIELLKRIFTGSKTTNKILPSKTELEDSTDGSCADEEGDEYDYPDVSKMVDIKPVNRPKIEPQRYHGFPEKNKDHLDSLTEGKVFQKPVCKIVPTTRPVQSGESPEVPLPDMTVDQLYSCLIECGLQKLAEKCKSENLDGDFICRLDEKKLKESFEMVHLDVLKIEQIKKGWRPKKK